jgi:hypothetical protein
MRLKVALLCLVLVSIAPCANAFPLTGGNGQINATVVGTFPGPLGTSEDQLFLDVLFDYRGFDVEHVARDVFLKIDLVDSDDKFYEGRFIDDIGNGADGTWRNLYVFDVPPKIDIKRVRIDSRGPPFSIEWTGVPEVKDTLLGIKFYGITRNQEYDSQTDSISADIKITNLAQNEQEIGNDQFVLIDQIGYPYKGSNSWGNPSIVHDATLLPTESMRFNLVFDAVSRLSRPVYLKYLPSNLTMDISAWV